jgi:fructokinase
MIAYAVEAGGTKFVCAVVESGDPARDGARPSILSEARFPTTGPEETIGKALEFFASSERAFPGASAIGVGTFGPADLDPSSPSYGFITTTPKPGWRNVDLRGELSRALGLPVGFDTDVNAACLAEATWGAGAGLSDLVYLTVGTGIGGGALIGGRLLHGLGHPEMGHFLLSRDPTRDPYPGKCPYHGACLEGLASGPAIEERWGAKGESLPDGHEAWALEADYLAQALSVLTLVLSPMRIILGGGVMERRGLFPPVRRLLLEKLAGYIDLAPIAERVDEYVVAPGLGRSSGILGAAALGFSAARGA